MVFCSWNKILSDVYSCSFHVSSKYGNLSRHIEEPQSGIYCLNFLKKCHNWKSEGPETLFHIRSNLLCLVCRCVVSFLFALRCIFHCVRTWCVVWEWHCMSGIATVTKEGGSLWTVNSEFIWQFFSLSKNCKKKVVWDINSEINKKKS